ncbi:MAG: hypothetical protein K0R38_6158 [Polyangiaceae bacterium]|jgi:hypothetical protein|nr:hypothetical protein [Polyangiaceae bacterium]
MSPVRRWLSVAGVLLPVGLVAASGLLLGCGGAPTRLVTVKAGTGEGPIQLEVKNLTDAAINNFYLAPSERIPEQLDNTAPDSESIWGVDLLAGAIAQGTRVPVAVPGPGSWDAKATDRDGRYQHVSGLKFAAGGRYILELNEGGWRVR